MGSYRKLLFPYCLFLISTFISTLTFNTNVNAAVSTNKPAPAHALVLTVNGSLNKAARIYIQEGLQQAAALHASVIILQLTTDSSFNDESWVIANKLFTNPIPVITYIAPIGTSTNFAALPILYASTLAVMAPESSLGARVNLTPTLNSNNLRLHPPGEQQQRLHQYLLDAMDINATELITAAEKLRSYALFHNRNLVWAEQALRYPVALTAEQAVSLHVVDRLAPSLPALLEQLTGSQLTRADAASLQLPTTPLVPVIFQPNLVLQLWLTLNNEQLLLGLGLLIIGILLVILESIGVGFGLLGIIGILAFIAGCSLLLPLLQTYSLPWLVLMAIIITIFIIFIILLKKISNKRTQPTLTGNAALIGQYAEVREGFVNSGWVRVGGEIWQARCEVPVQRGQKVKIVAVEGLMLTVVP